MKTIPVENLDQQLRNIPSLQGDDEPLLVMENSRALGVFIRVPAELANHGIDATVTLNGLSTSMTLVLQAKRATVSADPTNPQPTFGSCRDMLILSVEDEQHLLDFGEYMR